MGLGRPAAVTHQQQVALVAAVHDAALVEGLRAQACLLGLPKLAVAHQTAATSPAEHVKAEISFSKHAMRQQGSPIRIFCYGTPCFVRVPCCMIPAILLTPWYHCCHKAATYLPFCPALGLPQHLGLSLAHPQLGVGGLAAEA